jgi:hypothetical protein
MPRYLLRSGGIRAGYIMMIPAAGFSGIAAIIWAGESLMKIYVRLKDGKPLRDIEEPSKKIVKAGI